jgi:hypothetical protein
VGDILVK